jgi:hypothetical protein
VHSGHFERRDAAHVELLYHSCVTAFVITGFWAVLFVAGLFIFVMAVVWAFPRHFGMVLWARRGEQPSDEPEERRRREEPDRDDA